jgi:hypothetical protein
MNMTAEIITLRDATLRDVPAMMRQLADEIEAGEYGKEPQVVCVVQIPGDYPAVFGWGSLNTAEAVMELELAKQWFLNNLVKRT